MLLKAGVDLSRLRPEIRKKLGIIEDTLDSWTADELVINSTYEGDHSAGSLHYANLAIDVRSRSAGGTLVSKLKEELGPDYDVVDEYDHIHIEYDPKGPEDPNFPRLKLS